jgi:three-Cys-motif partner protein
MAHNLSAENDGLPCPEVGSWAETKYRLLKYYDELFSTAMRDKWDQRIYIDLYAGAGYSRVKNTQKIFMGSPMLALTVPDPFDKYIFCEQDETLFEALKTRVTRHAPSARVAFIKGNCDDNIERICSEIPQASFGNTVLSLCFVDPFDFGIKFQTIRRLASFRMDFVVLLAIAMDATRNYDTYVDGDSDKIDVALGNKAWRERWKSYTSKSEFRRFLALEFSISMESLGYLKTPLDRMKSVRFPDKNVPLYYLALFSRSEMAFKLWNDVLKYSDDQRAFFD